MWGAPDKCPGCPCVNPLLNCYLDRTPTSNISFSFSGRLVITTPLLNSSSGRLRSAVLRPLVRRTREPHRSWKTSRSFIRAALASAIEPFITLFDTTATVVRETGHHGEDPIRWNRHQSIRSRWMMPRYNTTIAFRVQMHPILINAV